MCIYVKKELLKHDTNFSKKKEAVYYLSGTVINRVT